MPQLRGGCGGYLTFRLWPCNQPLNLGFSSCSTSFLVTLSVHPSRAFCLSACHCATIITYFISLRFHFWWRLARVALLSLVTFISVRPLLGCGATFFMARMSWAICFPPLQPSQALSQPSETQQEKQPLDFNGLQKASSVCTCAKTPCSLVHNVCLDTMTNTHKKKKTADLLGMSWRKHRPRVCEVAVSKCHAQIGQKHKISLIKSAVNTSQ